MKARLDRLALMRRLILIWVLLVVCHQMSAQSNSAVTPQSTAVPAPQENSVLEFERELREEAKEHREYLKDSLDQLKWAVGAIVVLGGAVFGWLNYKSRKEIRAEVNTRFKTTVETMFDERMAQFDKFLNANRAKIDETVRTTDELLGHTADFVSVFTYGFALLERPSKDNRLELARRDVLRQAEPLRVDFPHWRHLAILLARLHVHFGEEYAAIKILTETIEERDKRGLPRDMDYGALLFNRACYQNLAAKKLDNESKWRAEKLRADAWQDLKRSVEIDPENIPEALQEPDFEGLWNQKDRRKDFLGKESSRQIGAGGRTENKLIACLKNLGWLPR